MDRDKIDFSKYQSCDKVDALTQWARDIEVDDKLLWKELGGDQLCFVRDTIPHILATSYEEYVGIQMKGLEIISCHMSKSVILPVYKLSFRDFEFVMRDNFYNWKISVKVPYWTNLKSEDFSGLFDPSATYPDYYCEGFPKEYVYKSFNDYLTVAEVQYSSDRKFTIEIRGKYEVYTFFYVLFHRYIKTRKT